MPAFECIFKSIRNPINPLAEVIAVTRFGFFVGFASVAVSLACGKSEPSPAADAPASTPSAQRVAAAPAVDLCSLVTKEEAEGVLKKPLAAPQKQPSGDCWYMREGGSDFGDVEFILSFIAAYPRSEAEFHSFVADQVKNLNENMKKAGAGAVFSAEPVKGLDAPAYFIDPGLYVLTGNRVLAVGLGGDAGVEIARIALKRI